MAVQCSCCNETKIINLSGKRTYRKIQSFKILDLYYLDFLDAKNELPSELLLSRISKGNRKMFEIPNNS